jgi:hypothetical protein
MGFDPKKFILTRPGNGYRIHYAHRTREGFRADPNTGGTPMGLVPLDGVHGSDYVDAVARSLDSALAYYRNGFLPPASSPGTNEFQVYLCNLGPGVDGLTIGTQPPTIWLRNRYEEACGPLVLAKIQAACAHVIFHAYQAVCCPDSLIQNKPWAWWSEATATFMETQVWRGNDEFMVYLFPWLDTPNESSYVAERAYGGMMLCEFLAERFGCELVFETWRMKAANPGIEYPTDAINDLLMKKGSIPFGSVTTSDFFGTQFCLALYFPAHAQYGFRDHGKLFADKFGHVFVTGVHELKDNPVTYQSESRLYGLSAEYHIIELCSSAASIEVSLECVAASAGTCPIKGVIVCIDKAGSPTGSPTELFLNGDGSNPRYAGRAALQSLANVRELLIVVVNPTNGRTEGVCREYKLSAWRRTDCATG